MIYANRRLGGGVRRGQFPRQMIDQIPANQLRRFGLPAPAGGAQEPYRRVASRQAEG